MDNSHTETKPSTWEEWRKSSYRILTPAAYELYKKYRTQIISDQAQVLEKDTKGKTALWINTLKTWMSGGFQEKKFNAYEFQSGGVSLITRAEIQKRRSIWKRDRQNWQTHWTQLAHDLNTLVQHQSANPPSISGEWGHFQKEEACADCTYRWNDKIRHLVDDFLTYEARAFDDYTHNRDRPGYEAWRWEIPWIHRRMKTLSDTIQDWAQMRNQNQNPKWIPPEEKIPNAPCYWDLTIKRIKNTELDLQAENARDVVKMLDSDFWKKSCKLWEILPNQSWQLHVWWLLFGAGETGADDKQLIIEIIGDNINSSIRNTNVTQREFELSDEIGNHGRIATSLKHIILLGEGREKLTEFNHMRDWVIQMSKLMETLVVNDWSDTHVDWNSELPGGMRRWTILSWLGWNFWNDRQTNQNEFIQQMDQLVQNQPQKIYKDAWKQMRQAFI